MSFLLCCIITAFLCEGMKERSVDDEVIESPDGESVNSDHWTVAFKFPASKTIGIASEF